MISTKNTGTSGTDFAGIRMATSNSTLAGGQIFVDGRTNSDLYIQNSEAGGIVFSTYVAGAGYNHMRIANNGNILIGTTLQSNLASANNKLEITH